MKLKHLLFIGGLNSSGNKARYIEKYMLDNSVETVVDIITPNYTNDASESIISDISYLLKKDYDFIVASSTGALFLLKALGKINIKPTKIVLINPLLSLSDNLRKNKDSDFLENVIPLMEELQNLKLYSMQHQYTFFLSEKDEVIGSQTEAIKKLEFSSTQKTITINDNHRFSLSMNMVAKYILEQVN